MRSSWWITSNAPRVLHCPAFTIWVICMHYAGDKWTKHSFCVCGAHVLDLDWDRWNTLSAQHLVFTTGHSFYLLSDLVGVPQTEFELSWQPSVILETTRSGKYVHNMETREMTLCLTSFYKTSFFEMQGKNYGRQPSCGSPQTETPSSLLPSPTVPAVGEQTSPRPFGKKRRKCARIVSSDEEDGESAEVNGLFNSATVLVIV